MMKAYAVYIPSLDGFGVSFGTTAGKARYQAYLSAKDASFEVRLIEIVVKRAPEYDIMQYSFGKPLEPKFGHCYSPEYLSTTS